VRADWRGVTGSSGGPILSRRCAPPRRAAPAVTGDVQDHQADRRPADHIQRVVRPQVHHPRHPVAYCQHEREDPQRRGSTSSPAIAKVMMACPEVKLSRRAALRAGSHPDDTRPVPSAPVRLL